MYVVHHYNFGNTCPFETLEEAKEFCRRAAFDAAIYHNGERIARYSAISGWHTV